MTEVALRDNCGERPRWVDSGRSPGRARKTRIPPKAVIETGDDQPLLTIATACLKAIANSQFVLFSFLGGHVHMSDYKIGKAVFIAAAVTLANPSLAQSPATSNQAAMTFAVEKRLFVCRQWRMGFLFVF